MADTVKPESKHHAIKWPADLWAQIEAAAQLLTQQHGFPVSPTDIIRSGTTRRVSEILADVPATAAPGCTP